MQSASKGTCFYTLQQILLAIHRRKENFGIAVCPQDWTENEQGDDHLLGGSQLKDTFLNRHDCNRLNSRLELGLPCAWMLHNRLPRCQSKSQ